MTSWRQENCFDFMYEPNKDGIKLATNGQVITRRMVSRNAEKVLNLLNLVGECLSYEYVIHKTHKWNGQQPCIKADNWAQIASQVHWRFSCAVQKLEIFGRHLHILQAYSSTSWRLIPGIFSSVWYWVFYLWFCQMWYFLQYQYSIN